MIATRSSLTRCPFPEGSGAVGLTCSGRAAEERRGDTAYPPANRQVRNVAAGSGNGSQIDTPDANQLEAAVGEKSAPLGLGTLTAADHGQHSKVDHLGEVRSVAL